MTISDLMNNLLERWEHESDLLRRHGAIGSAQTKAADLAELREWWRDVMLEELTLEEAVAYSGLAYDTIRRKLAEGEIPNAGRKGRPRVRRGDLPMKPPVPLVDPEDLDQIAGRILAARGK